MKPRVKILEDIIILTNQNETMDFDEWKNMNGTERKKILAEHKAELLKLKVSKQSNQTDTVEGTTKKSKDVEN